MGGLLTLVLIAIILLQFPAVQTRIAGKVLSRLEKMTEGTLHVGSFNLQPFRSIVLKDVYVLDDNPAVLRDETPQDTLFRAATVTADFTLRGLLSDKGLFLRSASVDEGLFSLVIEGPKRTNIKRIFHLAGSGEGLKDTGEVIRIKKMKVTNFEFRMISYKEHKHVPGSINWDCLDVWADIKGHDFHFSDGEISAVGDNVSFREKSGYSVSRLSGKVYVSKGLTKIKDIKLTDPWSEIDLPYFGMTYHDTHSFKYFLDDVSIAGTLAKSSISSRSLAFFAHSMQDMDLNLNVDGAYVSGPVNNIQISGMSFSEKSGIHTNLECRLIDATDLSKMSIDADIRSIDFTTASLGDFIKSISRAAKIDLSGYAPGEQFVFSGKGKGPMNALSVTGLLKSRLGNAATRINVKDLLSAQKNTSVKGNFSTESLNVGGLLGIKQLQECSLKTAISASLGKTGSSISVDSLNISGLKAFDYEYTGIDAAGTFSNNAFNGKIICNDPNLNFLFQGTFNLSNRTKNALYRFYFNLGYADLHAINIDPRGISKADMEVNADFIRITKGDLLGKIDVKGLTLENETGRHEIGNIAIGSHSNDDTHRIHLESTFANGTYTASQPLTNIVKDIQKITSMRELPVLYAQKEEWKGENYNLHLDFSDSRDLLSFIMPGLYIADSTAVNLRIAPSGALTGSIVSPRIAMGSKYLKGLELQLDNKDNSLNGLLTSKELNLSSVMLKDNNMILFAEDNRLGLSYQFDNDTELANKGELFITGEVSRGEDNAFRLDAETISSNVYYNGEAWSINPADFIVSGKGVKVDSLMLASNEQSIILDGGFSKSEADTMGLFLNSFDISILSPLIGGGIDLGGTASGRAFLTSPTKDRMGLIMSIASENTTISGADAGTVRIGSSWEEESKRLNLFLLNNIDGKSTINARGTYMAEDRRLSARATLDSLDLAYAATPLRDIFTEVSGRMHGSVSVAGPMDRLSISSKDLRLENAKLNVAYTAVPYWLDGQLHIDDRGLYFDDIAIKDRYEGHGNLTGGLKFNSLRDMNLDAGIRMNAMECLNTENIPNESFYGHLFADGSIHAYGPFNKLHIDVDAATSRNGRFHIPLNVSANASNTDILTFKEQERVVWIDPYEQMMQRNQEIKKLSNDIVFKVKVAANSSTEAVLEIDKASGNILSGRGTGTVTLDIRPSKDQFSINGDYNINSGNCHISVLGIASKDFEIQNGSSIIFRGDVMESTVDINALYTAKTSLERLIANKNAVTSRRTVECGINISDKLRNPKLAFSINVPDLDPTVKSQVESALSTDDKVQKQFLSLLLTNSFLPDEQSGIVNNSNIVLSNVANIMSNQLNNIMERLDIPVDLGLSYQSTDGGTDIFDVAVSTQLFNNRVIVNGAIGNRQFGGSTTSDVVGDLDIEIKLDKAGELRMTLFSHSADEYTNYLDNSQRNGAGVAYQKEFRNIKTLFKSIFHKKKDTFVAEPQEKVVISIEKTE